MSRSINKVGHASRQAFAQDFHYPAQDSIGLLMRVALFGLRKSFRASLDRHGIPWSVWYYLRVLWETDGLSQGELIKRVGAMQPNAVTALRTMEQLKLVRIVRETADRRRIRVWLTPKARQLEKVLLPEVRATVDRVALRDFTKSEKSALKLLLNKVCQNVQENAG